jgi:soluble lytic murein transglycosylase
MAYAAKRRRKEKRHIFRNFVLSILVLALLAGAVLYFVGTCFDDTKVKFEKLNYPQKYTDYVEKAAQDYSLDPALIYAVIRTESNFDPTAQSEAGAYGIMQVMPSSFEWLMEKRDTVGEYTAEDLFDPEVCIDYGSYLLKFFYDYYGTEQCAVAAYNAGFVVSDWLEDSAYSSDGKTLDEIPYPETSSYVSKVETAKQKYIELYYS